ncbi:MAG: 2-oxoacid:acceptor oxidoreductase family protein [Candidatus Auribacterota bacterium]|nr:2-oxoacid:acceptor oxidoreductase family protein [Candidatus Auribacterota bacterium]
MSDKNTERIIIAGFGGQGVMLAGKIVIQAGLSAGLNVTYIPSYGAEVRGGTAHCHVIISEEDIASPIIARPDACLVMNSPSLFKFADRTIPGGIMIINSSLVDEPTGREDVIDIRIPANRIAEDGGNLKAANMAMLGAHVKHSKILTLPMIREAITKSLPPRHRNLLEINLFVLREGYDLA